jgi:hypothetical protein
VQCNVTRLDFAVDQEWHISQVIPVKDESSTNIIRIISSDRKGQALIVSESEHSISVLVFGYSKLDF